MKKKPTKQWIRTRRVYWQDKWKLKNSCQICGYNKNPRALCFDHLKSSEKHSLAKNASNRGLIGGGMWHLTHADIPRRDMINEWRKCRILCSNCHMESTYPDKNIIAKKGILIKKFTDRILKTFQNWGIGGLSEN